MDLSFALEHLPRLLKAAKLTIELTILSLFFGVFVGIFFATLRISNNKIFFFISYYYSYIFLLFGQKYFLKNEFDNALDYLNESKDLMSQFPDELPLIDSMISKCFLGLKDYKKAEITAIKNLSRESLSTDQKKDNYTVLESVYTLTGDMDNLIRVKDSLIKMNGVINTSNIRSAFSKLETQILLSEKQSELNESKIRYNTYLYFVVI